MERIFFLVREIELKNWMEGGWTSSRREQELDWILNKCGRCTCVCDLKAVAQQG